MGKPVCGDGLPNGSLLGHYDKGTRDNFQSEIAAIHNSLRIKNISNGLLGRAHLNATDTEISPEYVDEKVRKIHFSTCLQGSRLSTALESESIPLLLLESAPAIILDVVEEEVCLVYVCLFVCLSVCLSLPTTLKLIVQY